MKEEFDTLQSDFLGDDLDIELSDSSLDGYDDDFELQSPKVSNDDFGKYASGPGLSGPTLPTYLATLRVNCKGQLAERGTRCLSR